MANARIVTRALPREARRVAEIGAGDGAFAARLAQRLRGTGELTLLDRQDIVGGATLEAIAQHGWKARAVQADVFDWLRDDATPRYDAIVANLFLHHFEPRRLAVLLELAAARARVFVACEPRRSGVAMLGSRLLGLAGCNDVTRHDAVVSVRAGFRDREISALWPIGGWDTEESPRGLFSHCFIARRR
jgi:hypothetical protein